MTIQFPTRNGKPLTLSELEKVKDTLFFRTAMSIVKLFLHALVWSFSEKMLTWYQPDFSKPMEEMTEDNFLELYKFVYSVMIVEVLMGLSTFFCVFFKGVLLFRSESMLLVVIPVLATLVHLFFKPLLHFPELPGPLEDFAANIVFTMNNPLLVSIFVLRGFQAFWFICLVVRTALQSYLTMYVSWLIGEVKGSNRLDGVQIGRQLLKASCIWICGAVSYRLLQWWSVDTREMEASENFLGCYIFISFTTALSFFIETIPSYLSPFIGLYDFQNRTRARQCIDALMAICIGYMATKLKFPFFPNPVTDQLTQGRLSRWYFYRSCFLMLYGTLLEMCMYLVVGVCSWVVTSAFANKSLDTMKRKMYRSASDYFGYKEAPPTYGCSLSLGLWYAFFMMYCYMGLLKPIRFLEPDTGCICTYLHVVISSLCAIWLHKLELTTEELDD